MIPPEVPKAAVFPSSWTHLPLGFPHLTHFSEQLMATFATSPMKVSFIGV